MMMKYQSVMLLLYVALLCALFSAQTDAFTSLHTSSTRKAASYIHTTPKIQETNYEPRGSALRKSLALDYNRKNYNNENDDNLLEDWKTLTTAAGNIVSNLGTKLVHATEKAVSGIAKVVTNGAKKFKNTFLLAPDQEQEAAEIRPIILDTQDEDLFRSVFGEGLFPSASNKEGSVDHMIHQAASILQTNDVASSLLGSSLRYGRPFSQSSQTTSINGNTKTTVQARLEVFGNQGEGIASVMSDNGKVVSLDLEIDGRLYRCHPAASTFNRQTATTKRQENLQQQPQAKLDQTEIVDDDNDDGSVDVEILEGIRIPRRSRTVMDAEIEGKAFL